MKKNIYFFIAFGLLLFGCTCGCLDKTKSLEQFEKTASAKYKDNYTTEYNSDSTYVLCINKLKPSPQDPNIYINFFVFDLEKGKIVYEKNKFNGTVKWQNNYRIIMNRLPEIIEDDLPADEGAIIYDLKLKKEIFK